MHTSHKIAGTESGAGNTQEPAALVLDERGMIRDCSKAGEQLFGYRRSELAWQHISRLIPQLSDIQLVQSGQINPHLEFLCHCGLPFQAQNQHGDIFDSELHFIHLGHGEKKKIRLIITPSGAEP
jgi:PAS domain S-box-containing protein